jgi:protein ImuB
MNYAVFLVPDFALHALRRADPALAGKPVALVAGEGRKAVLTEISPEAKGLEVGLPTTMAMARCPGVILRTREPAVEVEAGRMLLAAAFSLSPRVEMTAVGCCTADLQGADPNKTEVAMKARVRELAAAGLPAKAGAGATPFLAAYAASIADPVLLVRDSQAFLKDLPLKVAEPTPAQLEILQNWGLKTLGDLTALTKADVGERLGTPGMALWERAAGEATRMLRQEIQSTTFGSEWAYDPPVDTLVPLTFKLQRFAERVALELRGAGMVAEALTLTLLLEDETDYRREFRLPEPGTDVASWMRVLLSHLEPLRLASRLVGARFLAAPGRPQLKQQGLFDTGLSDPAAFWENLARLAAIVGEDRVGTPRMTDTHRPDTFILVRPPDTVPTPEEPPRHASRGLVLRRFRPSWPVGVTLAREKPIELSGNLTGTIRLLAGPWRSSGDWWQPNAWAQEVWHIELDDGAAYQLAKKTGGWFVDGVFD